jgi:hypothetical protein
MTSVACGPLWALVFPAGGGGGAGDVERWREEGFSLRGLALAQRGGGPCGVLAAVQGFMLAHLLSGGGSNGGEAPGAALDRLARGVGADEAGDALVEALALMLWRARPNDASPAVVCSGRPAPTGSLRTNAAGELDDVRGLLLSQLEELRAAGGVLLFVLSLLQTRGGAAACAADMDDAGQGLTGAFGHCTQELMNLLLCGRAHSQVHDGTVDLGGGMVLRGVPARPRVGYLSHMEALRYCTVGSLFKRPSLPVWVVGSDSHYTVLACGARACNDESPRTRELGRARRAFNELDREENGFVAAERLPDVLRALGLAGLPEPELQELAAKCDMGAGAGIILWGAFWRAVRPLLLPPEAPPPQWQCPACTLVNEWAAEQCDACAGARPAPRGSADDDDGEEGDDDQGPVTLEMLHINGLGSSLHGVRQGPRLARFSLTTVSKDLQAPSTHGHGVPIEEVLHTRWPGCVCHYPEGEPPSING